MRIQYYKNDFYLEAKNQRKKTLILYFIMLGVYLLLTVGIFLWYGTFTYEDDRITTVKIIQHTLSTIFIIISVAYLGIKFKRVNKYYKKCIDVHTGLTETSFGNFIEFNESIESKDGVDFKSLVFLELNKILLHNLSLII